ncbi:hypothetical protein [Nocardia sp. NPDC050175]|uniref:hypothetical protein n=1 Tax=Nocardia sp. NPDC050175 TaxID=3364317 RepID=UPI00379A3AB6
MAGSGRLVEIGEYLGLLVHDDGRQYVFQVIDVEASVERLVQQSTHLVVGIAVEGVWIGDEVQRMPEHASADSEFLRCVGQPGFEALALALELDQLHANLRLGHRTVGEQVDESSFLLVEFLQLAIESRVQFTRGGLLVPDGLFQ